MNTGQSAAPDLQTRDWPLSRLIAFSTMVFTSASLSIFAVAAIFLSLSQPDLGNQSIVLPILGTLLIAGSFMAALGLLAGVRDLTRSRDKRGITVISVVVNGIASLLVCAIIITGLTNV